MEVQQAECVYHVTARHLVSMGYTCIASYPMVSPMQHEMPSETSLAHIMHISEVNALGITLDKSVNVN